MFELKMKISTLSYFSFFDEWNWIRAELFFSFLSNGKADTEFG